MVLKKSIMFLFAIFATVYLVILLPVQSEEDAFTITENRIQDLTEEEQKTLDELYGIQQSIERLVDEQALINKELQQIKSEIEVIDESISKATLIYENNRNGLEQVLKTYQRMGPASFVEILLSAETLSDFIKRINVLKDLANNTQALMDKIDDEKQQLEEILATKVTKQKQLEKKELELEKAIEDEAMAKLSFEKLLDSLKAQRTEFEAYLTLLDQQWNESKEAFITNSNVFKKLAEEGLLQEDSLELNYTFMGIVGVITEERFNQIIETHKELIPMKFIFTDNQIEIHIQQLDLTLFGTFVIDESNRLLFKADSASFYQIPVEKARLDKLMSDGPLILDMTLLLNGSTLTDLLVKKGAVEVGIQLNFGTP